MELQDFKLEGTRAIGGRFGSAIAFIGDINLDGFNGKLVLRYPLPPQKKMTLINKIVNYINE